MLAVSKTRLRTLTQLAHQQHPARPKAKSAETYPMAVQSETVESAPLAMNASKVSALDRIWRARRAIRTPVVADCISSDPTNGSAVSALNIVTLIRIVALVRDATQIGVSAPPYAPRTQIAAEKATDVS